MYKLSFDLFYDRCRSLTNKKFTYIKLCRYIPFKMTICVSHKVRYFFSKATIHHKEFVFLTLLNMFKTISL